MSADNYYVIFRLASNKFVPVMYFASDDEDASIEHATESLPSFPSLKEAVSYCQDEYTEYGFSISPECWE